MDEACGEESESDLVLAVVPPVRRRLPWAASTPPVPPAPLRPPPVVHPPLVAQPPPVPGPLVHGTSAADGGAAPVIVAGGAEEPAAWPDRRWWTSTAVSTVVHVAILTILALVVTPPDADRRPKPFVIVQAEPEEFTEPEEFVAMEVAPPDPDVAEPVDAEADAPAAVADAGEAAFDVPDDAVGVPELDAAGLGARIGGGAAAVGAGRQGAGFGGDVGRRLAAAGAKTGDVQVSLSWDNFNDLDLHVVSPSGERIFFAHRMSRCRGRLDVDMNAGGPATREPVENVFWPATRAPSGEYRVFVHHFSRHDPDRDDTAFTVHVLVDGRKRRFTGSVNSGDPPLAVAAFRKGAGAGGPDEGADDEFVE